MCDPLKFAIRALASGLDYVTRPHDVLAAGDVRRAAEHAAADVFAAKEAEDEECGGPRFCGSFRATPPNYACTEPLDHAGDHGWNGSTWANHRDSVARSDDPRLQGCNRCDGPLLPADQLPGGLCPSCVEYYDEQIAPSSPAGGAPDLPAGTNNLRGVQFGWDASTPLVPSSTIPPVVGVPSRKTDAAARDVEAGEVDATPIESTSPDLDRGGCRACHGAGRIFWAGGSAKCSRCNATGDEPERPSWTELAIPEIRDVLAEHTALTPIGDDLVHCGGLDGACHNHFGDWEMWRTHVADLIAERLANPNPAQRVDAGHHAADTFPQHTKPNK